MSRTRSRTMAIILATIAAVIGYIIASIAIWLVDPIYYGFEEPRVASTRAAAVDLAVQWVQEVPGRTEVSVAPTSFEVREVVAVLDWASVRGRPSDEGWIVLSPQIGPAQYVLLVLVSMALAIAVYVWARPSRRAHGGADPVDQATTT